MEQIFLTAAVLLLPMLCTTAGAAGVFLLRKTGEPATRRMLCGMAAGIMLAASVWSLLLPAIERAEQGPLPAWVPPAVGLLLGAVGLLRLETLAGRLLNAGPGRCGRMVLAVTLHNLPEGMVVGLAAALALRGEPDAISGALALALGIGLQNIPEGAAVSLPLAQEGRSKCRAFAAGAASGLVEPLGGLLALALAGWVSAALPWLMSLAAGCMVCGAGCCPVTQKGDRAGRSPFLSVSVLRVFRPAGYPAAQSCTAGSAPPPAPFWRAGAAGPAH